MIKTIISPAVILLIIIGGCYEVSKALAMPLLFIDFPSIIMVLVISVSYSYSRQENQIVAFGNGAVYGGWLVLLIGLIGMSVQFADNELNIKGIMEANSVLWLGVFYGYSIRLIVSTIKK